MIPLKKQKCLTVLEHDFIQAKHLVSFKNDFERQWVSMLIVCKRFKITLRVVVTDLKLAPFPVFGADLFQSFFKLVWSKKNVTTIIWVKGEEICL